MVLAEHTAGRRVNRANPNSKHRPGPARSVFQVLFVVACSAHPAAPGVLGENPLRVLRSHRVSRWSAVLLLEVERETAGYFSPSTPRAAELTEQTPTQNIGPAPRSSALLLAGAPGGPRCAGWGGGGGGGGQSKPQIKTSARPRAERVHALFVVACSAHPAAPGVLGENLPRALVSIKACPREPSPRPRRYPSMPASTRRALATGAIPQAA